MDCRNFFSVLFYSLRVHSPHVHRSMVVVVVVVAWRSVFGALLLVRASESGGGKYEAVLRQRGRAR